MHDLLDQGPTVRIGSENPIDELQDWTYTGKPLVPLKGYPGVVWERPKSRKRPKPEML